MKLILNKQDIMNLLAWIGKAKSDAEEVGIPFDEDEEKTYEKIRRG